MIDVKIVGIILSILTCLTGVSLAKIYAEEPTSESVIETQPDKNPQIAHNENQKVQEAIFGNNPNPDFNGDGLVGIADEVVLLRYLAEDWTLEDYQWGLNFDLNGDQFVDVFDVIALTKILKN